MIETDVLPDTTGWTVFPLSCTEMVKRSIGLRGFWVWTPYQLYKRLMEYSHEHSRRDS